MHARVLTGPLQPGAISPLVSKLYEQVLPAAKQQQGFTKIVLLTDPQTHQAMLVTLWEQEDHLKASETSGFFSEQLAGAMPMLAAPPTKEVYEVAIAQMPPENHAKQARVMIGHPQSGQVEEATRLVRDVFLPAFQKQQGFSGLLFLVDSGTDKCISVSFWESQAQMQDHETSGEHGKELAKGAHLMVEPQQIIEQRQYYGVAALA